MVFCCFPCIFVSIENKGYARKAVCIWLKGLDAVRMQIFQKGVSVWFLLINRPCILEQF